MMTVKNPPPVELIPVQRRPRLAHKIPLVSGITHGGDSQAASNRWQGTTPHGRELIRKKLWELERQLLTTGFAEHWPKIESMLPAGLFSKVLSADQDECVGKRICEHLTATQQWAAYRDSIMRCARAVAAMQWCPGFMEHRHAVAFLQRIAEASELPAGRS